MTYIGTKNLTMTSSPWTLPAVPNYYALQTKLLLKSNVRKQKSKIKNGGKCSNRKKSKFKSWTNLLSAKNIAGRIPETTRIVVQNNLYSDLDKIRISKKTLEITKIRPTWRAFNFQFRGVGRCWCGGGGGG